MLQRLPVCLNDRSPFSAKVAENLPVALEPRLIFFFSFFFFHPVCFMYIASFIFQSSSDLLSSVGIWYK